MLITLNLADRLNHNGYTSLSSGSRGLRESASRTIFPALTGVRALAAIWVVLYHFRADFSSLLPVTSTLEWLLGKGYYGVDLFFILSGFILSYTYSDKFDGSLPQHGRFLLNRLARLYPVHLFTLLALPPLVAICRLENVPVNGPHYELKAFVYNVLLVQTWGLTDGTSWNYPSWSLSAEWFAYLFIFPLSCVFLAKISKLRFVVPLAAISLVMFAVLFPVHGTIGLQPLVQVTLEFFAGCCLYRVYSFLIRDGIRVPWLAGSSATVVLALLFLSPAVLSPFLLLGFAGLILGLTQRGSLIKRVLDGRVAVYLGEISFALYMSHGVFQKIIKIVLPSAPFVSAGLGIRAGVVAFYLLSMLSIAALIYHMLERPARNYLRARITLPKTAPETHAAASTSAPKTSPLTNAVLNSAEPESISAHL